MKVIITNTTMLNGGDAAINEATVKILRAALGENTRFVCYDSCPEVATGYYPRLDLRRMVFDRVATSIGWSFLRKPALLALLATAWIAGRHGPATLSLLPAGLARELREYLAADVVVSAGGTYLTGHYRLAPRIFDFLIVLALRRPLVLFTQSIGSPTGWRDRFLLRAVFRRASLIMVRDERSRQNLHRLGVRSRAVVQCPDAAFALADAGTRKPVPVPNRPPHLAVSIRDWPHFDGAHAAERMTDYLNAVAGFVRRVVEEDGGEVTLLSTCQGIPEYWTDDSRTARGVLDRLPPHIMAHVKLDRLFRTPEALMSRLGQFDCVIATRMHAAILALCRQVPVVAIAYEFKTRELFAELDVDCPVLDIETVTADALYAHWKTVSSRASSGQDAGFWRRVGAFRQSALASGQFVAKAIVPARPS